MSVRRICAVIGCLIVGTSLGGVGHATQPRNTVRTCEEVREGVMECDDGTTCFYINGVWVCEPNE